MALQTNSETRSVFYTLVALLAEFLEKNTNVIELYNLILKEDSDNQQTWYNSGIGTYAPPSWKSPKFFGKVLFHTIDLAIAWSVDLDIASSYAHSPSRVQGFRSNSFGCLSLAVRQLSV